MVCQATGGPPGAKVLDTLAKAQQLEYTRKIPEAVQLLRQALEEQGPDSGGMARLQLQQQISHVLFTEGKYDEALKEAREVYEGVCSMLGENTAEAVVFGLRLGILEAAAGDTTAGNPRIYRAGALVAPNLQRMVEQAQQLGQQGDSSGQLQELEVAAQKLAVCLGESNYYGSIFTVKHLVEQGRADDVVQGWENLDTGLMHGMTNLLVSLPPGTHSIQNAVREHDRLVQELSNRPELGELLDQQSARLHRLIEEGPPEQGFAS
ncbi:hypothetical protein N2152v2_005334 [Parachlorella kessleri]